MNNDKGTGVLSHLFVTVPLLLVITKKHVIIYLEKFNWRQL
jgi:hypothetical protein